MQSITSRNGRQQRRVCCSHHEGSHIRSLHGRLSRWYVGKGSERDPQIAVGRVGMSRLISFHGSSYGRFRLLYTFTSSTGPASDGLDYHHRRGMSQDLLIAHRSAHVIIGLALAVFVPRCLILVPCEAYLSDKHDVDSGALGDSLFEKDYALAALMVFHLDMEVVAESTGLSAVNDSSRFHHYLNTLLRVSAERSKVIMSMGHFKHVPDPSCLGAASGLPPC